MDYAKTLRTALDLIRAEGRYRIFADLKRKRGDFPSAQQFTNKGDVPPDHGVVLE